MSKRYSTHITQVLVYGCFLYLTLAAASADTWPITFAKAPRASAHGGAAMEAPPNDCQPDSFDPQTTQYHAIGNKDANPATYRIDGGDNSVTLMIDSRDRQDDIKIQLPEPYSVTRYIFKCASGSSEFLEFRKSGKRYAIHAHVSQAKFTPDGKKLVFYNYAKPHHGSWQSLRRIFDIRTRRFIDLPVISETAYLADAGDERFVTYAPASKQNAGRRIAVIWGMDGKLIQTLSAADRPDSSDAMGLLPDEPSTFYHLTRTGDNECTIWLQDTQRPEARRAIKLAIPGKAADPASIGTGAQLDLSGLKLSGGAMKYRISPSGAGNVTGDWGPWQKGE